MDKQIFEPCPFCGAFPEIKVAFLGMERRKRYEAVCVGCGACIGWFENKEKLIEHWNTRSERRYAHWVQEQGRLNHWHCSKCETVFGVVHYEFVYCPCCGSKMMGVMG